MLMRSATSSVLLVASISGCAGFVVPLSMRRPPAYAVAHRAAVASMSEGRDLALSSAVTDVLASVDLVDPSKLSMEEQDQSAAAAATAVALLLPGGIITTLLGAVGGAYAVLRKDDIGTQARTLVGKNALDLVDKAKEFDREQKITEGIKAKVDDLLK